MANQNILTYNAKVSQVEQLYTAPLAEIPGTGYPISTIYVFLGRTDAWTDDNNPPTPTQDQQYLKNVFKNIFVAKKVQTTSISPVLQRVDWTTNTVYDYYRDDKDMFAQDTNGNNILNYYVRNRYDQVFKCLWNNNGSPSTKEPFFQPGTYGTNNIFQDTDGYKWKYMYTIDIGLKSKFMDNYWMPIPVGANTPNPLQTSAGCGDIEVINVTNGGSGYSAGIPVTVTVTGDGTGATGVAYVTGDKITDIKVNTGQSGTNYTYANVTIQSANGSNATAISPISPIGGHAFDPISELGCSHVMIVSEFKGTENGYIPVGINYTQVGIIINPTSQQNYPYPATQDIYDTTMHGVVTSGSSNFNNDEIIFQGNSLATATFKATVLSFDSGNNLISMINTSGTPINNSPIFGSSTGTVRTLLSTNSIDFVPYSGYLAYVENRSAVQRSSDGIEQFKFVLGY
jgi:hypothetical protein